MKRFFLAYLVLGFALTVVGGISLVVAQTDTIGTTDASLESPAICATTSPEIIMIIDFVREMMNSIKTIGPQGAYLGKYVNPSWFEENTFVPPKQDIVSQVSRNLQQKALFGVASAAVFTDITNWGGIKDVLGNTTLLARNKVFLRDTKRIEELESQLSRKKLEIGLGGGWFAKINPTNRAVMLKIIDTYVDKGLFTGDENKTYLNDGVLYVDLVSLLTQMLSSAKTFLALNTTYQFTAVSRGLSNGIRIAFVDTLGKSIQAEYDCARGLWDVCDTNKQSFKGLWSNLKLIVSGGINNGFVATFIDANDRLVQTFSKEKDQTDQFKARKNDLLQSTYGRTQRRGKLIDIHIDDSDGSKDVANSIKDIGVGIANGAKIIANTAVSVWKYATNKDFPTLAKEQKEAKEEATLASVISVSHYDKAEVLFENALRVYVRDVFVQQALDIELASFAEVKDITPAFEVLGAQIATIKNKIIGSKNQEGSLIKALGDACELQCANKGGTCRK